MVQLRLVNKYWPLWATRATRLLKSVINWNIVGLSRLAYVIDDGIHLLWKFLSLTSLNFGVAKNSFAQEITNKGVIYWGSIRTLMSLNLGFYMRARDTCFRHFS